MVIDKIQILLLLKFITDDLKWDKQIADMSQRAFAKIWILRRLKSLGASRSSLLLIYYRHVRSIVEYAAPAWHKAITQRQIRLYEKKVQFTVSRRARHISEFISQNNRIYFRRIVLWAI